MSDEYHHFMPQLRQDTQKFRECFRMDTSTFDIFTAHDFRGLDETNDKLSKINNTRTTTCRNIEVRFLLYNSFNCLICFSFNNQKAKTLTW